MKKKEEERVDESNCEFRLRFAEERERERERDMRRRLKCAERVGVKNGRGLTCTGSERGRMRW